MFIKPCKGVITSGFQKNRLDPVSGKFSRDHVGIDFGSHSDNTIVASAFGTVIRAGVLGTFGNCIMLTHYLKGQLYTTVYAHLASMRVKVGDTIPQGVAIGVKGSTGNSTGIHLHFEIHKGHWSSANKGVLNPILYMIDPAVLATQKLLVKAGYNITTDGINGPGTQTAVRAFQTKYKLAVDGMAGPATQAKLKEVIAIMESANKTRYSDVPKTHAAYDALERVSKLGIINGYPDGTFKPNTYMTRAQLAVVIDRLLTSIKG